MRRKEGWSSSGLGVGRWDPPESGKEDAALRRRRRWGALACGAGAHLAGLVMAAGPAGAAGPVTLEILWNDWGGSYNEYMKKIGEAYHRAHPDVTLAWHFAGNWEDRLTSQIAAGEPPDVTYTNYVGLPDLARRGLLQPLDALAQEAGLERSQFVPAMWDAVVYGGRLYALPGGGDYIALFYNRDLRLAAGLDPDRPPSTIDAFTAEAAKLTRRNAQNQLLQAGYLPSEFIRWAYLFGGRFYDADLRRVTLNDPQNEAALAWMQGLAQRNGPIPQGIDFLRGNLAFAQNGFWYYAELDSAAPGLSYGVAPMPTPHGREAEWNRYFITGWDISIPVGAPHAKEAWAFIKWAFVDRAGEMGALTLNGPTPIRSFPEFNRLLTAQIGPNNRLVPYLGVFNTIAAHGAAYWPATAITRDYFEAADQVSAQVLGGKTSPKQALDAASARLQALLDARRDGKEGAP